MRVTSLLIAFFFFIDKVLAFVRVGIISRQYAGSVELLDTFNAANNLPDVLFALISGGALAMAFIPLMSEYLTTKGRARRVGFVFAGCQSGVYRDWFHRHPHCHFC